jgi:NADH-quinone oxidoreductase subunit C
MAVDAAPLLDILRAAVPEAALEAADAVDMPTLFVDRDHAFEVLQVLRDHPDLQCTLLADITAIDRLPAEPRFEVVYHLACLGAAYATGPAAPARRVRVKVALPSHDPRLTSLVEIYPGAGWPEREVFDLFGVTFERHPDLRRILTAEDWTGYPLRKDYPVQVRKTPQSWQPIQLSVEEFAENMRQQRAGAAAQARETEPSGE